jgi:hypothetical protein
MKEPTMIKTIKHFRTYPAALVLAALLAIACARTAEPAKTEEAAQPEVPAGTVQLTPKPWPPAASSSSP